MTPNPVKENTLRRVHVLFLVMFAITGIVSVTAWRTIGGASVSSDWVNRTHAFIYELDGMMNQLQLGEGMMRTYALTGEPRDFTEARAALATVLDHLAVAKAFAGDEEGARESFERLERIARERAALADALFQARADGRTEEVRALLQRDSGSTALGDFRREVERRRNRQFELLSTRDRESYRQAHATRWVVGVGAVLNILLFGAVALVVRDDIANRRRMTAALQEANQSLEQRVQERTAELVAANRRLTFENLERKWASVSQEHQLRYNQLIVNSVSDLVFVLTKVLTVTRINPAVPAATGLAEETLLGKPLAQFLRFHPQAAGDLSIESIARALKDGREISGEAELTDSAGRLHAVRATVVPLRDNDAVVGAVAVVHPHRKPL